MSEWESDEELSQVASVFIAAKTDRREKVQQPPVHCPNGMANDHLKGPATPWGRRPSGGLVRSALWQRAPNGYFKLGDVGVSSRSPMICLFLYFQQIFIDFF